MRAMPDQATEARAPVQDDEVLFEPTDGSNERAGPWAVFAGGRVVGLHPSQDEAIRAAYREFGLEIPFVVDELSKMRPFLEEHGGFEFSGSR